MGGFQPLHQIKKSMDGDDFEEDRKRKLPVAPRVSDYKELILQFVKERFLCEAKELDEVIMSGDFPIEVGVRNVLIESASSSDPAHAISFLRFMLEKQRSPTLLTVIH